MCFLLASLELRGSCSKGVAGIYSQKTPCRQFTASKGLFNCRKREACLEPKSTVKTISMQLPLDGSIAELHSTPRSTTTYCCVWRHHMVLSTMGSSETFIADPALHPCSIVQESCLCLLVHCWYVCLISRFRHLHGPLPLVLRCVHSNLHISRFDGEQQLELESLELLPASRASILRGRFCVALLARCAGYLHGLFARR